MTAVEPALASAPTATARSNRPAAVALAFVALVLAYGLLSLWNDPRGTLGTDTGGKLATLAAMDRNGTFDPDIGYWAEDVDPDGDLHPLYYTAHIGDRWVNVTTLPMVLVARPLYTVGGARAVLLVPMLGAAFAALAARALARRVGGGDGWWAFWCVGLVSPLAVYALDFWEHAPGVALMLWAVVFLVDVAEGRAGWRGALVSGACFGVAATMRTEALVYALVAGAVTGSMLLRRTSRAQLSAVALRAAAWLVGIGLLIVANQVIERLILGGGFRASRAAGTAGAAGTDAARRMREAATTAVGINQFEPATDWMLGALVVVLVGFSAWQLTEPSGRHRLSGATAFVVANVFYLACFGSGLGFVPGLLSASPLAAAGLAIGWSARRWRPLGAVALLAVPLIWVFQYSGGANPQWGARYLLVTGTLLVVGAAVVLGSTPGWARGAIVGLAACVTLAGIAWLSDRSHTVADAAAQLRTDSDTVLVSREAHLLREGGAFLGPSQRWLTAENADELDQAVRIAESVGAGRLEVVQVRGRRAPGRIGDYVEAQRRIVEFLPGLEVVIVRYEAARGV